MTKGSDKIDMTINIGGEFLKLSANFEEQDIVREAESDVRLFFNKLRKNRPESSDRQLLAMVAYQFSLWRRELLKQQESAIEMAVQCNTIIENHFQDVR